MKMISKLRVYPTRDSQRAVRNSGLQQISAELAWGTGRGGMVVTVTSWIDQKYQGAIHTISNFFIDETRTILSIYIIICTLLSSF